MSFMYGKLLGLAFRNLPEFAARIRAVYEVQIDRALVTPPAYTALTAEQALSELARAFGAIQGLENEPAFLDEDGGPAFKPAHRPKLAISNHHDADPALARFVYAATKICRPNVILETGVAHGVTSAAILQALEENGHGELHSVDLPPLRDGAEGEVGVYVPAELRGRWHLHRGASRTVLPKLLPRLAGIELFVHDSLHTAQNIRWELESVTPHMAPVAVIIADDIHGNDAFLSWADRADPYFYAVAEEAGKDSLFGVALIAGCRSEAPESIRAPES